LASINVCIQRALDAKSIPKEYGDIIAASPDPIDAINVLMAQVKRQQREAAIQAVRIADAWDNIKGHKKGVDVGLMSLLVKDSGAGAGYHNVEAKQRFYRDKYHAIFGDGLNKFRTRWSGLVQDEAGLNDFVRVLFGQEPLNKEIAGELVKMSDAYRKMLETSRTDLNRMGGHVSKNDHYNLPQNHDVNTILKRGNPDGKLKGAEARVAARENWKSKIRPLLNRQLMTTDTGRVLSDAELDEALDYTFESITTNGLNKAKDFAPPSRISKKMSNKNAERRFLHFKDAESWLSYQNEFGRGDVFQTMISNVEAVARDVGTMEVLGPNPVTAYDALLSMAERHNLETEGKPISGARVSMLDAVFKTTAGYVDQGHMTGLADFMQSTRNVITASKLGAATLSALSDEGFTALTAAYNKLPITGIWSKKAMLMSSEEMNVFAVKMGLGAEAWTATASAGTRFGDFYQTGVTGKMAEVVIRGSGLQAWTDAGRKAFTMEFASALAENFGKSFDDMNAVYGRAFDAYGITRADWEVFSAHTPLEYKGAKYADMMAPGSEKFHQMVMSEVDYAVPTPDARVRAITTWGQGRGTVSGQVARSIMNLKSFPITLISTHMMRMMAQPGMNRLTYGGAMLAMTTMFGAVAMLAKDVAAGREPRPMGESPEEMRKFWGAAAMQGGGMGIFGDFLFADHNRFGGGLMSTAFGPTGQLIDSTAKLTLGNAMQLATGDDMNLATEAIRFIEDNAPGTFYTQPMMNALFDQAQLMADPKMQKKMNAARRKRMKDYGQGYWWNPGEATPELVQ
jgi:hypothetical protein